MSSNGTSRDSLFPATFLVVAILAIVAFRAAFSAYFMLDDFGMLAISRFLANPFDPFIRNQFPGGLYYRSIGMLVWWLSERTFGAEPLGHYCLNLLLHGLVVVALGVLVKLHAKSAISADSKSKCLSWGGSGFDDVTAEVLNGSRKPAFVCN